MITSNHVALALALAGAGAAEAQIYLNQVGYTLEASKVGMTAWLMVELQEASAAAREPVARRTSRRRAASDALGAQANRSSQVATPPGLAARNSVSLLGRPMICCSFGRTATRGRR
jgi:hypothetical protein